MKIHGYEVITNPSLLDRIYYKKQTRKFKNKRWNKKYLKKYSSLVPSKKFYVITESKTIIGHPATIDQLVKIGTYSLNPVNYQEPSVEKLPFDYTMRTWGFGIMQNPINPFINLNCIS